MVEIHVEQKKVNWTHIQSLGKCKVLKPMVIHCVIIIIKLWKISGSVIYYWTSNISSERHLIS